MRFQIKIPEYSILGFKILNSWQSIFAAYILLLFEYLLIPYFGDVGIRYISGLFFILLLNLSFIILILNSCIRQKKINFYFFLLSFPLFIYAPYSIRRILVVLSSFR